MWIVLVVIAIAIAAIIITARVSAKRAREEEERARQERKKAHFALEAELFAKGPSGVWPSQAPDVALRSLRKLGNVGYLVWLLHSEPLYRDHRGQGEEQYPPDWEWRRGFVFLRDRGKCQGHRCGAAASLGATLDCHHIKPIREFGPEEKGIHALTNLVTLCPICHASQHPGNTMMSGRATNSWSRKQRWFPGSAGRRTGPAPKPPSARKFDIPREVEVHPRPHGQPEPSDNEPGRTERECRAENVTEVQGRTFLRPSKSPSQRSVENDKQHGIFKAKSIAEGLAIVDEQTKAAYAGKRPDVTKSAIAGPGRERQPTRYERELMVSLGFETLEELIGFLNLPPHPDLDKTMHPPDTSASERWDRFLEDELEREQAKKKK